MSSFKSYRDGPAVHEKGMTAVANEVSFEMAQAHPSFVTALRLLEKWNGLPGDIPHHKHISPATVGSVLLPYLFIMDVVHEEGTETDFRWRLFGTAIRRKYGLEATGHLLSDALGLDASIDESLRLARKTFVTRAPTFMHTQFYRDAKLYHEAQSVILPLSGDDGTVTRIFGCTTWSN